MIGVTVPVGVGSDRWKIAPDVTCVGCGKAMVFVNEGGGDFYVGNTHMCAGCGCVFTVQEHGEVPADDATLALLRAALSGKAGAQCQE